MKQEIIIKNIKLTSNLPSLLKDIICVIALLILFAADLSQVHATKITSSQYVETQVLENYSWLSDSLYIKQSLPEVIQWMLNENYQAVIERLEQLKANNSNNISQCYLMTLAYVGLQKWQEANAITDECISMNAKWPVIYSLKGTILFTLGKHAEALQQYDIVIDLIPESAGGYLQRAKFHFSNQKNDNNSLKKALEDIKQYKQKNGDENAILGLQGLIYLALEQESISKVYLSKAINIDPDNLLILEKLLPLYYKTQAMSKARKLLNNSLQSITPEDIDKFSQINLLQAKHAILVNDTKNAEAFFKTALQAKPSNINALKEFIYWLDKQERLSETVELSKQGLQYHAEDKYFTSYMAWALADAGTNLWQAKMWLKKAKKLDPNNVYLSDTQAWISVRQSKYQQAFKDIQPSLTYASQVPEIAYHAGVIFSQLGKNTEAIKYLQLSLKSSSSFTGKTQAVALLAKLNQE